MSALGFAYFASSMPKMGQTKYLKGECQQCRGHIEFPVETTGMTIDCPHCGKPTELLLISPPEEPSVPRKAIIWTGIAALILGLGLAGSLLALKRAQTWSARQKEQTPLKQPADINSNAEKPAIS